MCFIPYKTSFTHIATAGWSPILQDFAKCTQKIILKGLC